MSEAPNGKRTLHELHVEGDRYVAAVFVVPAYGADPLPYLVTLSRGGRMVAGLYAPTEELGLELVTELATNIERGRRGTDTA